ncbi:MAG: P-type conjugative transfer ATPase TrbB, partial [Myxococcota bacterium]
MQAPSNETHAHSASLERVQQAISHCLGPAVLRLLGDKQVVEILLNADGSLWAETLGKGMHRQDIGLSAHDAQALIRLVASHSEVGVCNEQNPSLSCAFPLGKARFQAFLPPLVCAPAFSIRKHAVAVFTLQDYVNTNVLTPKQHQALVHAVHNRHNVLIVGGTGSGKTTLANALLHEMARTSHRVITIEDTPELNCVCPNTVQIVTRANIGYTMRHALRDVLRFRPDRIVVGEVRDGSALDLLKAWNTGHNGGVATIHANSAQLGLTRLESLIAEVAVNVPRDLIAQAVNVVLFLCRTNTGRQVREVLQVHAACNN